MTGDSNQPAAGDSADEQATLTPEPLVDSGQQQFHELEDDDEGGDDGDR